jgi:hypothetical protein
MPQLLTESIDDVVVMSKDEIPKRPSMAAI